MKPLFVRRVVGHSMEPTLHEGDIVFASDLLRIRHGDIVVARVNGQDVIKRYTLLPDETALLVGDNPGTQHEVKLQRGVSLLGRVFAAKPQT